MSGGTPVGGGYMRQRHSQVVITLTLRMMHVQDHFLYRLRYHQLGNGARFWRILFGLHLPFLSFRHSNFIYLLWHDDRIRRLPLYFGMLGVGLNVLFFVYTSMPSMGFPKFSEELEFSSTSALPLVTLLGLVSFCLFCFALWPIWSFLTFTLVFTLFMVILPYLVLGTFKPQNDLFRTD